MFKDTNDTDSDGKYAEQLLYPYYYGDEGYKNYYEYRKSDDRWIRRYDKVFNKEITFEHGKLAL